MYFEGQGNVVLRVLLFDYKKNTPYLYLIVHYNGLIALNISKGCNFKNHPGHVVGVGTNLNMVILMMMIMLMMKMLLHLKLAGLCIKRKGIKEHWTDEGDVGRLAAKH